MRVKNIPKKKNLFIQITLNILVLILLYVFIPKVFSLNNGYKWAYNNLLKGNMKTIKEHPNLSTTQKYSIKIGTAYQYLNYIKKQTPKNAVILWPTKKEVSPKNKKSPFGKTELYNKMYATRFLWPRKLVLMSEKETSYLKDKISYVAIVNGEGFKYLGYNFPNKDKIKFAVIKYKK